MSPPGFGRFSSAGAFKVVDVFALLGIDDRRFRGDLHGLL